MSPTKRLLSLDVFRGLTVAAMIVVNSPGNDAAFAPLRHAAWHGWTPTDLIFPAFLVIMGVSAAFAAAARDKEGRTPPDAARRVFQRAAFLVALGLIVNLFILPAKEGLRLPGVLQRIALCYLGVEAFLRLDRPVVEPVVTAGLLVGYWLLLTKVPVPGHGAGVLTPDGNFAYWLDRRLLGGCLLDDRWGDPEGLVSTMGALATTLLGLMAGRVLRRLGPRSAPAIGLTGLALAALGAVWSARLPLNKHLWSSSYALFAGGLSLAGLALCVRLIEGRSARWTTPFEALGRSALAVYVLAGLVYGIQEFIRVPMPDGSPGNLKLRLSSALAGVLPSAQAASLAYALAFTGAAATAAAAVRALKQRRLKAHEGVNAP